MDSSGTQAGIDPDIAGRIIAVVGTEGFGAALDDALRAVAPFDLTAIIAYPDSARPVLLHDGLHGVSPPEVMEAYLDGSYLLDAIYAACHARVPQGLYRLTDVAPDEFLQGNYYASAQVHPCISMETGSLAEEIAYLVRFPDGHYASYSLMRSNGRPTFAAEEFARLAAYEPVVRAAILRQWAAGQAPADATDPPARGGEELEAAFRSFAADRLSPQEQRIVSLILRGHSSGSIGLVLGISEGTVKNHRKHIHAKLGISSQAQLFALFVDHVRR